MVLVDRHGLADVPADVLAGVRAIEAAIVRRVEASGQTIGVLGQRDNVEMRSGAGS